MSVSLSLWYPGSGVVLDSIDSLSVHPYLLSIRVFSVKNAKICILEKMVVSFFLSNLSAVYNKLF